MLAERYTYALQTAVRGKFLGLKLRPEFRGDSFGATHVELANQQATGASQLPARYFLDRTFPSSTLTATLEAVQPGKRGLVVMHGSGGGKSHNLAALHHWLESPDEATAWARRWAERRERTALTGLGRRKSVQILSESLDTSRFQLLWDWILNWHLRGEWGRVQWAKLRRRPYQVPTREIFAQMFEAYPTVLIIDGFDTWYERLPDTHENPFRSAAWEMVQHLASIATEHPDRVALVLAVNDTRGEAFEKLNFLDPVLIDTDSDAARDDRGAWMTHRIFENRLRISEGAVRGRLSDYVDAYAEVHGVGAAKRPALWRSLVDAWPFAPGLVRTIEERIAIDEPRAARRAAFRLLIDLFESQPRRDAIITAGDIGLADSEPGIAASLCAAMAARHVGLRDCALKDLAHVVSTLEDPSYAWQILAALWLRSVPGPGTVGADAETLRLEVTDGNPIDPEWFRAQVRSITDLCLHVHERDGRFVFREEPNPRGRLLIEARSPIHFRDGSDRRELANQIRYVVATREDVAASAFRVVVLRRDWRQRPWEEIEEELTPPFWDGRLVLVVIPESPKDVTATLSRWLQQHVPYRRNTVRFLLPVEDAGNIYDDNTFLMPARGMVLADRWETENEGYLPRHEEFQSHLRELIRRTFTRFVVVDTWNEEHPSESLFHIVRYAPQGWRVPDAVDAYIRQNLVKPGCFSDMLAELAAHGGAAAQSLQAARERVAVASDHVPWTGSETLLASLRALCEQSFQMMQSEDDESDPSLEFRRTAALLRRKKP